MDELLKWIAENKFELDVPDLDGKIHRFDRDGKKNAWFWGVRLHGTSSGQEYIIAKVGDWKTDEEFEFKTNAALGREDKKVLIAKIKEGQVKAEAAKAGLQLDASETAVAILGAAREQANVHYLEKKGITRAYGTRVTTQGQIDAQTGRKGHFASQPVLLIPMRDSSGRLWGLQQINAQGKKYFITGQRIEACFHLIPDDADLHSSEPIYIVEGFATGVSVHEATQSPVAVAFNAGNLTHVARALRADSPDRPILIAGDDDIWGKRQDGTPYNAGRDQGDKAAAAVYGRAVYPKFRSDEGKPTDWNDLHVREGIEQVKAQLMEIKAERHYVRALGHRDGSYFYTSSANKEIVHVRAHSPESLMNLMPLAYWESVYPGKTGANWYTAADDLMQKCRERGIFAPENLRGLGVWDDAGRTVVHLGNRLNVDGVEVGIHDIESKFIYQLAPRSRSIHPKPLTAAECAPIHTLMKLVSFERSEQKYFLAGWLMAARLSGILDWRPHIWITGESGSGKSTIMQQFVFPMLGEQRKRVTGSTTEPGMRQDIKANAVPVIYDEFEPDSPESVARVKGCIEFIRQSSTDSGDILKGGIGGEAIRFKARFCAGVSAIKTLLNTQADRTRFTLIELKRVHNDPQQWERVKQALKAFTPDYADRYFARLLMLLPVIRQNMALFEHALAEKHSQRLGQQYAPLLAGWAAIITDSVLYDTEVDDMIASIDFMHEGAASGDTDQEDCMSYLLQKSIQVQVKEGFRDDITVAQALEGARANPAYNEQLARFGLKLVRSTTIPGGEGVFVSAKNPQLQALYRDSSWSGGWSGSLARLPDAQRNFAAKIDGHTVKGVLIPSRSTSQAAPGQDIFGI